MYFDTMNKCMVISESFYFAAVFSLKAKILVKIPLYLSLAIDSLEGNFLARCHTYGL